MTKDTNLGPPARAACEHLWYYRLTPSALADLNRLLPGDHGKHQFTHNHHTYPGTLDTLTYPQITALIQSARRQAPALANIVQELVDQAAIDSGDPLAGQLGREGPIVDSRLIQRPNDQRH
jgi:hypothetical protein